MDKLVNYILGLEPDLWYTIPSHEKRRYGLLVLCFLGFVALSLTSSIFLVYMISSKLIVAISAGLMLAFVTFNIVRFSLIILRRSVYPKLVESADVTATIEVANKDLQSKFKQTLTNSVTWIVRNFNPKNIIPGLGTVIRLVILTTMCLLVVFPLTCLLHINKVEAICDEERTMLLDNFKDQNQIVLRTQLKGYEKQISILDIQLQEAEKIGIQDLTLAKNKRIERENLMKQMSVSKAEFESSYAVLYKKYFDSIRNRYFLVKCFTAATKFYFFPVVLLLVFALVFYAHLSLIWLKNKENYRYASISTDFYRSQIEANYKEKQTYLDLFLKREYPKLYPSLHNTQMYCNPPYCNIKNKFFNPRKSMGKTEFENSFNIN